MASTGAARVLPLFPLDAVVLFPGTRAPLHVFEPRYRQMTSDALAGDRSVVMIAVRPEHHHDLGGSPPLYGVGCAGTIERWRKLPDGRFDVLLYGTERVRILRELPPDGRRLYRRAEIEPLGEAPPPPGAAHGEARMRVLELLEATARLRGGGEDALDAYAREQLSDLDDAGFANAVAQSAPLSTSERQGLLEADGPGERLDLVLGALRFQLAALRQTGSSAPPTVH